MTSAADATDPRGALDPAVSASVQASAGSGKTWLLVSRIVRLLLAGAEPGGIIALTFTRKAAAEMRLRLNQRLALLAQADDAVLAVELERIGAPDDADTRARARRLYRELLFAPFVPRALTLDAFAQDLLNRFALEAGLEPGFALVEHEGDLGERVWRRLQARLRDEPDGAPARALTQLVELGHGEYVLREICNAFLARRSDWRALGEGQADAAAHAAALLAERLGHPDRAAALRELDGDAFNAHLTLFCRWLGEYGDVGHVRCDKVVRARDARGEQRLALLRRALMKDKGRGDPYKFEPAKRRFTAPQRETLLETHGEVLSRLEHACEQLRRAETLACSAAAMVLGDAMLAALDAELDATHALGFPELEWHAFRLLREADAAEWIRYKLDRRMDHLLLDEFQDTSPTQWRMLLPVLEEMAAGDAGRARTAFVVGDAKQSIYGFRRADPGLLDRATGWMQQRLAAVTRPLHDSRRSAPAVIAFVNALFEGDLGARIGFVRHGTHRLEDWGRVEIAPMVEASGDEVPEGDAFRDPLQTPRHAREDERAAEEARQVCARIRALVASGVAVRPEHGAPRAIGYGDVMVLARARTHLHALEHELSAAGIPFVGAARGTLLNTSEVGDLVALLRHLDGPHRNLDLAQALRSPLFGASDESLAALAAVAREHGGHWREALARLPDPAPELRRARALLDRWQPLARRLPAHDLLDRVLRDSDAAARYESALPQATRARARANLSALLQLALEADSGRYPNLPRFLRFIETRQRAPLDAPDEVPPPAVSGHLRIMTVHAAKGLEAPAVFVVNAGGAVQGRAPRLLVDWPTEALRPRLVAVSGAGDEITQELAARLRAREEAEDVNLLYVAMTRARQFLHVSGFRTRRTSRRSWQECAFAALERIEAVPAWPGTAPGARCLGSGSAPAGIVPPPAAAPPPDPRLRRPLDLPILSAGRGRASGPKTGDSAATQRGTAMHWLLQHLADGESDDARLLDGLRALPGAPPPAEDLRAWLADARALLREPALAPLFDAGRYARAWNEVPVMLDGVTAVIDRLVDDGAGLVIVDYKTHARPDAAQLAERYRAQLEAYAEAVRQVWPGRAVRAGLLLTATRAWVPVIP